MRGTYRSYYDAIWDDPDFIALGRDGQHLFFVIRSALGQSGVGQVYLGEIEEKFQCDDREKIEGHLEDMAEHRWIRFAWLSRSRLLIWIRNAWRFEPHVTPGNPNHVQKVLLHIAGLPRHELVREFMEYYAKRIASDKRREWSVLMKEFPRPGSPESPPNRESTELSTEEEDEPQEDEPRNEVNEGEPRTSESDTPGGSPIPSSRDGESQEREQERIREQEQNQDLPPACLNDTRRPQVATDDGKKSKAGDQDREEPTPQRSKRRRSSNGSSNLIQQQGRFRREIEKHPELAHDDRIPKIEKFFVSDLGRFPSGIVETIREVGVDHVNAAVVDLRDDESFQEASLEVRMKRFNKLVEPKQERAGPE